MPAILIFVLFMLLMPVALHLLGRMNASDEMLDQSFADQVALVNGVSVPASRLTVLHRWPATAARSRSGDVMQIDANWLCRTDDGHYVVGIAQGMREAEEWLPHSDRSRSPEITWTWRSLSETQVRNMLAGERKVYRRLFGGS